MKLFSVELPVKLFLILRNKFQKIRPLIESHVLICLHPIFKRLTIQVPILPRLSWSHMIAILILGRNLWLFWWECHVFCERFWINGFGVIPTLKRINNSRQESSDAPQNRLKPFLKFLRAFHLTKMAKMSLMDTKKNEPFSFFKTFTSTQT